MRKFFLVVAVLALSGVAAKAQTPRVELFTGLSYGQFNPGGLLSESASGVGRHFSMPGFEVTPQFNFSKWFGVVADVSAYGGTSDVDQSAEHARFYNYLVGPQLTARNIGPFNVFVRGLVGTSHSHITFTGGGSFNDANKQTRLAYGFGGGIDLNASKHIALRLIQIDLIRNAFTNCPPADPDFGSCATSTNTTITKPGRQNNARIAAGFEWRF
ncbi:MAG TPA: outer membrane beta-barrel protein [Candidatus Dormibacteraeota bacterium]|nr:outer membrane beta-barrel protein [Candidatus Dormibacteraeota bacterium]